MGSIQKFFSLLIIAAILLAIPASAHAQAPTPAWQDLGGRLNNTIWAATVDSSGTLYIGGDFNINPAGESVGFVSRLINGSWEKQGLGTDGPVMSFYSPDPRYVFTGGVFTKVGGATLSKKVNHIVQFDGHGWEYVGGGTNHNVLAIAGNSRTNVYVGGAFTRLTNYNGQSVAANRVAKWDGKTWSKLRSGVNGNIQALAVGPDGKLYAAGAFTMAGDKSANNIAVWNGTNWSPLGKGTNGRVRALQFDNQGRLIVGGLFSQAGGVIVNGIAVWDGTVWSALGSGVSTNGTVGTVYSIQVDANNNIYIGGTFEDAGGIRVYNVAKWNGNAWQAVGDGIGGPVYALALDKPNATLYAAGSFQKDGTQSVVLNRLAAISVATP